MREREKRERTIWTMNTMWASERLRESNNAAVSGAGLPGAAELPGGVGSALPSDHQTWSWCHTIRDNNDPFLFINPHYCSFPPLTHLWEGQRLLLFAAARRQFLLASFLPNIKQKMVSTITASLNLQLNMTCKLLDYTLDSSITGRYYLQGNITLMAVCLGINSSFFFYKTNFW